MVLRLIGRIRQMGCVTHRLRGNDAPLVVGQAPRDHVGPHYILFRRTDGPPSRRRTRYAGLRVVGQADRRRRNGGSTQTEEHRHARHVRALSGRPGGRDGDRRRAGHSHRHTPARRGHRGRMAAPRQRRALRTEERRKPARGGGCRVRHSRRGRRAVGAEGRSHLCRIRRRVFGMERHLRMVEQRKALRSEIFHPLRRGGEVGRAALR